MHYGLGLRPNTVLSVFPGLPSLADGLPEILKNLENWRFLESPEQYLCGRHEGRIACFARRPSVCLSLQWVDNAVPKKRQKAEKETERL